MNDRLGPLWAALWQGGRIVGYAVACVLPAIGLAVLLTAVGCGSGRDGLVPVSGQVTLDGTPVTSGRIEFFPETGRPASAEIDSEGRYRLTTYKPGDGVKPGQYVVTITSVQVPDDGPVYKSFEDELLGVQTDSGSRQSSRSGSQRAKWLVPQRYSNRSSTDLTAEVVGGVDIDFQLKSKP